MSQPAAPAQNNDLVYCHECENEWYRRDHGLTCPDCHSDFTEIVEAGHDPRNDEMRLPPDDPAEAELEGLRGHYPWAEAADPDEEDIGGVGYGGRGGAGAGAGGFGGGFGGAGGAAGMQGGGLMGLLGNMIGGFGGALQHQQAQAQQAQQGAAQGQQLDQGAGGSRTRHIQGPGYSFTMTTSGGGGAAGNLFPRNARQPQPFNGQPDQMDRMMQQMLNNIGVFPGLPNQHAHPHQHAHAHDPHNPFPGPQGGAPFPANLFQLLGLPPGMAGGVHGDAVYSQEALDRIVTQLMEQHTSGNAPGPASSSAISSLPTRQITREDTGEGSDTADCSICMDGVPLGAEVTMLPCKHWFHGECVRAWLQEHDSCPHCRQGIVAKDSNTEGQAGQAGGRVRGEDEQPLHNQNAWQVPGAFPEGTTGERGTRDSPFTVPESPRGTGGSAGGSSAAGVFGRMRDAFGGGPSSSSSHQANPNNPGSSNSRS